MKHIKTQDELFDESVRDRFFKQIEDKDSGCIEWIGPKTDLGYGRLSIGGRENRIKMGAHRWAFQFIIGGRILSDNVLVCHKCDNPSCVAPDHLFLGTNADNMADMVAKGRSTINNKHSAKLLPEQVAEIKHSVLPAKVFQEKFSISKATISDIRNNKIWKDVD